MPEDRAAGKVVAFQDVPAEVFGDEAPGVSIRVLIDERADGAPVYVLRMMEIAPGGHTPDHEHAWEHENYVLDGNGRVLIGEQWHDLAPGHVVFIPPGVRHTYANAGEGTFRFLCGIPVSRLRE